ncbi:MAG: Mov34/MPN/PAD-1 family protein [Deltaproteobacteria bacterium]
MSVFGLELTDPIVEALKAHAVRDYPVEACGVVLGNGPKLTRVVPMENVQDKYHARDPEAFPRTGRDAFRMNDLERMRVLDEASEAGLDERIIYHSHCDAGAYFSPEDRAMAVQEGIELTPGVVYVVVSVREGVYADLAAYQYDAETKRFVERRLGEAKTQLPDLSLRTMEGKEAARPLRPVSGALAPRRIDAAEAERLDALAESRTIEIEERQVREDLRCFAGGLYSPLAGFMRRAEVRSVQDLGRLPAGTPWRVPIVLDVHERQLVDGVLEPGAIVRLVADGQALAYMAVGDLYAQNQRRIIGGPVFVVGGDELAAESRARVLRAGAKRVLAVAKAADADGHDLSSFDLVLVPEPIAGVDQAPLVATERSPWLFAAMAQNQGATHVLTEDGTLRRLVADSLEVEPWP